MDPNKYKKTTSRATIKGQTYEFLVALLVYLRLKNNPHVREFRIATNLNGAGKFDDVVINYKVDSFSDWNSCFVQLKHNEKGRLSSEQFTAQKTDFAISKYIPSYDEIQKSITQAKGKGLFCATIERSQFIFYTNVQADPKLTESAEKIKFKPDDPQSTSEEFKYEELFRSRSEKELIFALDPETFPDIYKHVGDTNSLFLAKLSLFSGQCEVSEMKVPIKTELKLCFPSLSSETEELFLYYKAYFETWWQESDLILDEKTDMFYEYNYSKLLEPYTLKNISFSETALDTFHNQLGNDRFLAIHTNDKSFKVTITKLRNMFEFMKAVPTYCTLKIFEENEDCVTVNKMRDKSKILVLILETSPTDVNVLLDKIGNVLNENEKIKVLVISNETTLLVSKLIESKTLTIGLKVIKDSYSFNELNDTSKTHVASCDISFQSLHRPLISFFNDNNDRIQEILSCKLGDELIPGEVFKIGQTLPEELEYFIPRKLQMRKQTVDNASKSIDTDTEQTIPQSCLLSLSTRIEVIIAEAGMGKTTLLNNLAREMKKEYPEAWVVLVHLRRQSENLIKKTNAVDFLTGLALNDKSSKLEERLFLNALEETGNVVLICDGLDEVVPQYEGELFDLLDELVKLNFKKLILSSRCSMQNKLEEKCEIVSKEIVEFSEDDQRQFLQNRAPGLSTQKIEQFIGSTIGRTPLLIMMFTEVFKNPENKEQNVLNAFSIFNLVKIFVEEKFKIYFSKYETNQTKEDMEKRFAEDHCFAALRVFFNDNDLSTLLPDESNELHAMKLEKAGLVFSVEERKPNFIHKTFAEYFVGLWISDNIEKSKPFLSSNFNIFRHNGILYMLDNILAADSDLHKAVIEVNHSKVASLLTQLDVNSVDQCGRQAIHLAASLGFDTPVFGPCPKHVVEILRESGAHIDNKDTLFGWTPLEYALQSHSLDAADHLLSMNAVTRDCIIPQTLKNIATVCRAISNGFINLLKLILPEMKIDNRLLLFSAQYGHSEITDYVISRASNLEVEEILKIVEESKQYHVLKQFFKNENKDQKEGETCMHTACRNGLVGVVEFLLSQNNDVKTKDKNGITALHLASKYGRVETLRLLLDFGADVGCVDNDGTTPLHYASREGRFESVKLLIKSCAEVDCVDNDGMTPLHYASRDGRLQTVRLLTNSGAIVGCVDNDGMTPLHYAARDGRSDTVEFLIRSDAEVGRVDNDGMTPLHYASRDGRLQTVRLLTNYGAIVGCVDSDGMTPLHVASRYGHFETVEFLVKFGAEVDGVDNAGWTALHHASRHGHFGTVEILIKSGAILGRTDNAGWSPLHHAARRNHAETVRLLITSGAAVGCLDKEAWTPLHHASSHSHLETIQLLVISRAAVGSETNDGETPLHLASRNADLKTVQLLVDSGATVGTVNKWGHTPLKLASRKGHVEIANFLKSVLGASQ